MCSKNKYFCLFSVINLLLELRLENCCSFLAVFFKSIFASITKILQLAEVPFNAILLSIAKFKPFLMYHTEYDVRII